MTENTQQKNLSYYCDRFANLKVRTKYQPILLLIIIDLISQNIIEENKILISDGLLNKFKKYLKVLSPESTKPGLQYPFIALENRKILHFKLKPDVKKELITINKSIPKFKQAIEYVFLDQQLFEFIQYPESRKELIDTLIEAWFSSAQKELQKILEINQSFEEVGADDIEEETEKTRKFYMRKSLVRDSFFRKAVIHAYDYRCSLCQLRVMKSLSQSIVDGAHIKPFAQFYDNKIDNGISLCKNHHWAFDKGIFGINDNYQVLISDNFSEDSPNIKPIRDFQGQTILLPNSEKYFPSLEAVQWHRENIYRQ